MAETVLIDIDKYLLSEKIQFTRYVDDYRFFAPDLITAQNWMNKLTTRLFRDGLMLNTGKTQIRKSRKIKNESDMFKEEQTSEAVLKTITILTGGYNKISRKFTMPADDKHEVFKQINIDSELKLLQEEDIVEFQGVQKIVIAALIQQKFELLLKIAAACFQYLYTLDYFIDMLLKNAAFIPTEIKRSIANVYIEQIDNLYIFEWHSASVARLLSHESYFDKEALLKIVNSPAKDISTYASMIALDGLQNKLSRSEFITIRNYFERCDDWERRRLLNLSEALPIEERKAWGRAMMLTVANDFLNKKLCKELARG